MTGNNAGDFLLGVTYRPCQKLKRHMMPSPATRCCKIYNALDVNLRTIIKVQSTAVKSAHLEKNDACSNDNTSILRLPSVEGHGAFRG